MPAHGKATAAKNAGRKSLCDIPAFFSLAVKTELERDERQEIESGGREDAMCECPLGTDLRVLQPMMRRPEADIPDAAPMARDDLQ